MLNFIKERIALWRFQRTPLAQALRLHTQEYFFGETGLASFTQENKEKLIGDFLHKASSALQSPNAVMACREQLVEYTLAFAQLQVHCLKEHERRDQFYSASPYISGELWRRIRETSDHHDELARYKWETPELTDDELVELANTRCAILLYYVNGLNIVRRALGDMSEDKDWFRPLVEACLVNEEHQLREKLGMPTLVPGLLGSLLYGTFYSYVLNGEQNPFFAWTRDFPDAYLAGEGSRPELAAAE